MTVYLVRPEWPNAYREHQPGDMFEADLPPDVEQRAVARGAIEVLDPEPTGLRPGSWTPPDGWSIANHAARVPLTKGA